MTCGEFWWPAVVIGNLWWLLVDFVGCEQSIIQLIPLFFENLGQRKKKDEEKEEDGGGSEVMWHQRRRHCGGSRHARWQLRCAQC